MIERPDLLDLFRRQHGCAHVHQLLERRVKWDAIGRLRRRGALIDVLPNVVRLASAPDSFTLRAMAAQLQSYPEGYLSGFTAGAMRGLSGMPRQRIYVTVPRRMPGDRPKCHQRTPLPTWVDRSYSNWHDDRQVVLADGFRLEEVYSMMFTLAAAVNDFRFERIAEEAWNRKLITPAGVRDYVERYRRRGRSGVARSLHWVDKVGPRRRAMQSGFELDMLRAIREVGLPEPQKQHPLRLRSGEPIHFDLAWPDRRLALEPGHSLFHDGELLTARDQARDRACAEVGWQVLRFDEGARRDLGACADQILRTYRQRTVVA